MAESTPLCVRMYLLHTSHFPYSSSLDTQVVSEMRLSRVHYRERGVQMSLWDSDAVSFAHMPRSGKGRSCGSSTLISLKNLHAAFLSSCTSWHSHPLCNEGSLSPQPGEHLLSLVFHDSCPRRHEVTSRVGFGVRLPDN